MKKNNIILILVVFLSAFAGTALAMLIMNSSGLGKAQKEEPTVPDSVVSESDTADTPDEGVSDILQPSVAAQGNMFDGMADPVYTGEEADKLNNEILLKYKKILKALDKAVEDNNATEAVDSIRSKCHAQVYDYDGDGLYEMVTTFSANGKDIFAGLYRYSDVDKNSAEGIVRVTQILGGMSNNGATADIRIGQGGDKSLFLHCVYTYDNNGTERGTDHIYCLDRDNIYHIASLDWKGGSEPEYRKNGVECDRESFNNLFSSQSFRVSCFGTESPGFNLQEVDLG